MKKVFLTLTTLILLLAAIAGIMPVGATAASKESDYNGKIISILGDSISTYAGYIPTADGYNLEHLARYPQDNLFSGVEHTWWMQVIESLGAKLGINDSWRGTTLDAKNATDATSISNLQRIKNLGANGTPDVILLFGGTNDYGQLSNVDTFDPNKIPREVDLTTIQWKSLSQALVSTIMRIEHFYPDAQLVVMLPTFTKSYYSNTKLTNGNKTMIDVCKHFGLPYVDLTTCGISTSHLPDGIHPNKEGMDLITDAVMKVMLEQCTVKAGASTVHTVKHSLSDVKASLGYVKGVSDGKPFTETLTATSSEDIAVSITMGGKDVTAKYYKNGVVSIDKVTGDVVITASSAFSLGSRLQTIPATACGDTNLWQKMTPQPEYYDGSKWASTVYSLTMKIKAGDRIVATSFGAKGENEGGRNGIRVTWFSSSGVIASLSPDEVYAEFSKNGYITAPQGAVAVNVPLWKRSSENACIKVITLEHSYGKWTNTKEPTCKAEGEASRSCTGCAKVETKTLPISTNHSYSGAWLTNENAHWKVCSVCSAESEKLVHSFSNGVCADCKYTLPETTIPETTAPDTTVPETTAPETTAPDTTVPETTVPDTTVPETTVPETTVPDTTVPETTVPDTTAAASGGCGSAVALAIIPALAVALSLKRKRI